MPRTFFPVFFFCKLSWVFLILCDLEAADLYAVLVYLKVVATLNQVSSYKRQCTKWFSILPENKKVKEMWSSSKGLIIGLSVGIVIGVLLAAAVVLFFICLRKKCPQRLNKKSRTTSALPFRDNAVDASSILSDSTASQESPRIFVTNDIRRKDLVSLSGVPKYSYKDLKKATGNFTMVIGEGAFGKVYKAMMTTGKTVAVKELSSSSKQGEQEFQNEVLLLGRLHHKNLVNLVGYCTEKERKMLVYVYMPNGNLFSHLYSDAYNPLRWDIRICIALDVARGVEYLHDGANPPVVHRDIKPSNILLDDSMRARVGDFGLSKEEIGSRQASNVRGTFGYLDPEYVATRKFTKKSDVYSFGVLLLELITGRNTEQGLMEYVQLGELNSEDASGWEEIIDPRLNGNYDAQELNELAAIALKCVNQVSKKRPAMRDIVHSISNMMTRGKKKHHRRGSSITTLDDEIIEAEQPFEIQITNANHQRLSNNC